MNWLPIAVISLAQMLIVANSAVVSLSIGGIVAEFHTPVTTVQSALVVYWLVTAAFMILGGKLGTIYGSHRVFRIALLFNAVGMASVALSARPATIVVAEVVIGLSAAALVPSFIALIASNYDRSQRVLALGIFTAASGAGISVALILGGAVSSAAGWRAPFWLFCASAIALAAASRWVRPSIPQPGTEIDWIGAALSGLAIPLLTVGINNLSAWGLLTATPAAPMRLFGLSPALLLIAAGVALCAAFFAWQSRRVAQRRAPLLSPVVLDSAAKRSALSAQLLGVAVHGSIIFLLPLYTQIAMGVSAFGSSLRMLPYTLALLVASISTARLIGRVSLRRLGRLALVSMTAGLTLCALAFRSPLHDALFGLGLLITGLGAGATNSLVANVLVSSSPRSVASEVGAVRGTVNNLGGALGASLSGVILTTALVGALAAGLAVSSVVSPALRAGLDWARIGFLGNQQLERLAQAAGATGADIAALTAINEAARLRALEAAFLMLAGLALTAAVIAGWFPRSLPAAGDVEGDAERAEA
ncbi:MAG: MFS transporter [Anaerolineae bacterium]|nr:MFS transporter [Anaerolineae bacterium]